MKQKWYYQYNQSLQCIIHWAILCPICAYERSKDAHYSYLVWSLRRLNSRATRMFFQQFIQANNNENVEIPHNWSVVTLVYKSKLCISYKDVVIRLIIYEILAMGYAQLTLEASNIIAFRRQPFEQNQRGPNHPVTDRLILMRFIPFLVSLGKKILTGWTIFFLYWQPWLGQFSSILTTFFLD